VVRATARLFSLLALLSVGIHLSANTGAAKIELSQKRMTLKTALKEISEQTDLQFVYGDQIIADIDVFEVGIYQDPDVMLQDLLRQTGLKVQVKGKRRLIFADDNLERVVLTGFVIHRDQRLKHVLVSLKDSHRTVQTNEEGFFRFASVPSQKQVLRFQARDFIQASHIWAPEDTKQLIVLLEKQPFVSEHIRVARVIDSVGDLTPIRRMMEDAEALLAQNSVARDLFQGLEALAGVEAGLGETGVSVRGARPSENLVLLDGIKLYQIDHAMGHFSALNPDAIGEVALYKGSYPASYGNRLAGVLDVSTRRLQSDRLEGTLGVDRDMAHLSIQAPLGSNIQTMVAVRDAISDDTAISVSERLFSTTFNEERETFEEFDYIESARNFDFEDQLAHISWTPREDRLFQATYFRGRDATIDNLSFQASQFDEAAVDEFYNRNGRWGNDGASLRWQHYWDSKWSSNVLVSQSRFRTNFREDERYNAFNSDEESFDVFEWQYFLNTEVKEFSIQAQAKYEWSDHQIEFGAFSERIQLIYFEELVDEFRFEEPTETRLTGGFLQHQWHSGDGWHSLVGLRGGRNQATNETFFEPRIALRYDQSKNWQWRMSWGQYHQFVLRTSDTASYFNGVPSWFLAEADELTAATSEHFQAGMRYQRGSIKFDIEPYYKEQEGSLSKLVEPLRFFYELNQMKEKYRGIDTQLSWQRDAWSAKAAYSYRHSRVVGNETEEEPLDYPTDRDRPHVFDANLLWQGAVWDFWAGVNWQSGIPYTTPEVVVEDFGFYVDRFLVEPDERNTRRLSHSSQLDLRLGYRFKYKRLRTHISARVENLFDANNPIYRFFYIEDEYEREGAQLIPVSVNDFGRRFSLELRLAF
jgi:outer membrane receptor for ferrienterochelin and colicin